MHNDYTYSSEKCYNKERSNEVKFYIWGAINAIVLMFTNGGIIQTFFLEIGFSNQQIGTYTSLIGIVQIIVMILSVFLADSIRNVKGAVATLPLSRIVLCLAMLPACWSDMTSIRGVYFVALICCCIQNLFVGISDVLQYRLPYLIIDMKKYAKLENNNGIISGICSILVSGAIAFMAALFSYRRIMAVGFCFCIVSCLISFWLVKSMKEREEFQEKAVQDKFSFSKLWKREFAYFHVPNLLRGFAAGLMNIMAVVCSKEITSKASVTSSLATIIACSSIVGCALYQVWRKKIKTARLYTLSSILMCLFLPIMLIGKNATVFRICYFIIGVWYNIINASGSVYATEIVEYSDIGTYSSVRLIVLTLGQAISSYVVTLAMDYVPTVVILCVCGLCQLISGFMYHFYDTKYQKVHS